MAEEARSMLGAEEDLASMQKECARFVAEMHDNRKETDAFLAGLEKISRPPRPPRG